MLHRRSLLLAAPGLLLGAGCVRAQVVSPRASLPPARPLALPALPGGKLEPLGALIIDNAVLGFGGLSGLHLTDDLQLTAISDIGRFFRARLVLDAGLRPLGLAELRTGFLRDGAGAPLPRGFPSDAESLARLPDGSWLIGFERWHRLRAYRELDGPAQYVEAPPELAEAPGNGGLESVAVLADDKAAASMLVTFDPKSKRLTLKRVGGFQVSPDKSLQLWALPQTGGPKSLGVLGSDAVVKLTAAGNEVNVPTLAISLEEKGGVPANSGPKGPVLFKGALIETSL